VNSGPGPTGAHATDRPDEHLGDLVPDLVEGRLGAADPGLVLQHLDSCPDCRTELADAVVAAAALRGLVADPRPVDPRPADPRPADSRTVAPPVETPDSGGVTGPVGSSPGPARRRVPALAGALAVALLAVGVLGGIGWNHRPGRGQVSVSTAATPVTALFQAGGRTSGAAVITGSGTTRRMTIAADIGAPAKGTLVTVWLTAAGSPVQRIGTLDSSGHGSFTMSAATAAEYSAVVLTEQPGSATSLDRTAVVATARLT
jgi:hypothetical protein